MTTPAHPRLLASRVLSVRPGRSRDRQLLLAQNGQQLQREREAEGAPVDPVDPVEALAQLGRYLVTILTKLPMFGYYTDQMNTPEIVSVLDRQLLLQLGDRLRRLRQAQGLGTVEMAERVGVTRNTLRNVEAGDPGTSIGTYLRVMAILGVSGELALLAGDTLVPPPADSAAARSRREAPVVQVQVSADPGRHRLQDLQSLAFHEEAVRRVKADPALLHKAKATTQRWLEAGDPRSASLWREWQQIMGDGTWRKALGRTRHAQQLRQASPLVTVLPEDVRQDILAQVSRLRKGVVLGNEPSRDDSSGHQR